MKAEVKNKLEAEIRERIKGAEKVIDNTMSATEQSDALNRIAVSNLYNALVNLQSQKTEE